MIALETTPRKPRGPTLADRLAELDDELESAILAWTTPDVPVDPTPMHPAPKPHADEYGEP